MTRTNRKIATALLIALVCVATTLAATLSGPKNTKRARMTGGGTDNPVPAQGAGGMPVPSGSAASSGP